MSINKKISLFFSAGLLFGSVLVWMILGSRNNRQSAQTESVSAAGPPQIIFTSSTFGAISASPVLYNDPSDPFGVKGTQDALTIRKLLVMDRLFNGGRSELGLKQPLSFSDLALLSQLFKGEAGNPLTHSGGLDMGDLLVLNQMFNGGKSLNNAVSVSPDFGKLLLLYFLFHN